MRDYGEERRNELEALEAIYPDSFTVLSENPPHFTITVTSEAGENDETVQTTLKFTYSEKYPDEAPLYEIFTQLNLEDNNVADILKLLALQAEENLDRNLNTSNIQFLEDAGNNVEVDESLFQEMDDLELEDNDDDPDYNPADRERDLTD
ncbi:hypothetical protein MJG53_005820 [Ovis ammon polii x Ovis aries]|uniref:RWD domain-containing protein 1 n=2 Tax=Ovis TaxID=9935 RepID=A0A836ADI2_SHEEP|nr:hypothetical protein JEQ12_017479 [Ovis aries]KAI4585586.1 hypothetical protein MJG53_005820 [Ovis ammon polii x Ovis aries]